MTGWQELFFSYKSFKFPAAVAKYRYFRGIWLKIYRSPNFNMFFELVLTKFFQKRTVLNSRSPKVNHVINYYKRPIGACSVMLKPALPSYTIYSQFSPPSIPYIYGPPLQASQGSAIHIFLVKYLNIILIVIG